MRIIHTAREFGSLWRFVKPSKTYFFFSLLTAVLYHFGIFLAAIFIATATAELIAGNFNRTYIWLAVSAGAGLVAYIAMHFKYYIYAVMSREPYIRIQQKFADKIMSDDTYIQRHSRTKVLNVIHEDVNSLVDVFDSVAHKITEPILLLVSLITLTKIDLFAGLLAIGALIFILVIQEIVNSRVAYHQAKHRRCVDETLTAVSVLCHCKCGTLTDQKTLQDCNSNLISKGKNYYKEKIPRHSWLSIQEYWLKYIASLFAVLISAFLVYRISNEQLTVSEFIIIIPLLAQAFASSISFYSVTDKIKRARIHQKRIQTALES